MECPDFIDSICSAVAIGGLFHKPNQSIRIRNLCSLLVLYTAILMTTIPSYLSSFKSFYKQLQPKIRFNRTYFPVILSLSLIFIYC
ncbi:hypothetical protein TetV_115 [Tetraselmis virus 1]|uniref:Uncharacterized protein n=1 Tax=Tetraselmis virus 1 TaxID=2060617 RepID=A0A2P0VMS4_9VIRU|nr:hypothetical protein QJ968_gp115 [Tetraselmis virus 1]AUF82207.1 hypothetical protein TetV_115 [Tetraselmis virus 1]